MEGFLVAGDLKGKEKQIRKDENRKKNGKDRKQNRMKVEEKGKYKDGMV